VEPAKAASVALHAPLVNTGTMNVLVKMISDEPGPKVHAVLIMDQAGWHKSKALELLANIATLLMPPYSPQLNPVERLWAYLRSHYMSNLVCDD